MHTSPNCSTQKSRRTWKALVSWFQTLTAPGMKTRMYSFNASMPPRFCTQVSSKISFVRGSSSLPVKAVELLSDEAEAGRTVHATVKRTIAACFEPVAVETIAEIPAHADPGIRLATVTGMVVSA